MEKIKMIIEQAAAMEAQEIIDNKPMYHSQHEAYAILKEEIEEAEEELEILEKERMSHWDNIRKERVEILCYEEVYNMMMIARNAAAELVQVMAVCQKLLKQVGGPDYEVTQDMYSNREVALMEMYERYEREKE